MSCILWPSIIWTLWNIFLKCHNVYYGKHSVIKIRRYLILTLYPLEAVKDLWVTNIKQLYNLGKGCEGLVLIL